MMDRRDFFRVGAQKTAQIAYRMASEMAAKRAESWFRPPFAVNEMDFLLACTRCDKCIEACPHGVLFKLPPRTGIQAADTPAMDLLNRGCHLCQDWPCVTACEPGALRLLDHDEHSPPAPVKLASVRIDPEACLPYLGPECGACAASCTVPGALEWEAGLRPVINQERCTGCARCREACIVEPKAVKISAVAREEETAEVP